MSVNPGFGGQTFIPHTLVEDRGGARAARGQRAARPIIEVDGGVDASNAGALVAAGASILVAGASIFGTPDPAAAAPRAAPRRRRARAERMPASVTTVRVRYAETDRMGVVYYANYFVWFEVARADLLRTLGWTYREMEDDRRVAARDRGALRLPPAGALRR